MVAIAFILWMVSFTTTLYFIMTDDEKRNYDNSGWIWQLATLMGSINILLWSLGVGNFHLFVGIVLLIFAGGWRSIYFRRNPLRRLDKKTFKMLR